MTYKQAAAAGAQVRKGEKGSLVQYWKFDDEQTLKDAQGKPIKDAEGNTMKVRVELERPRPFYAVVFNAEQIEGLPRARRPCRPSGTRSSAPRPYCRRQARRSRKLPATALSTARRPIASPFPSDHSSRAPTDFMAQHFTR